MNGLSLFSGAGIGELVFKHTIPDYRTIGYVEWNIYDQENIRARIKDGVLDDAPVFGDIREFNARYASLYVGKVDFISAGFPCQPFSLAGKRQGEADERNMWPATIECLGLLRPRFALLENVPGLFTHEYIRHVFADLAKGGYDCQWLPLSAAEVGANHRREREWILAYSQSDRRDSTTFKKVDAKTDRRKQRCGFNDSRQDVGNAECSGQLQSQGSQQNKRRRSGDTSETVADSKRLRPQGSGQYERFSNKKTTEVRQTNRIVNNSKTRQGNWDIEPELGRVAHGVANRVDRLKALGNGWVPQVVKEILQVTE